ncbi:unnamed protein product [Ectocarpus sp. 6 AP-2014]
MQGRLGERSRVLPRRREGVPKCSCSNFCWNREAHGCFARASWETAHQGPRPERGVQQATQGGSKRKAFEESAEFLEVAAGTIKQWELEYRTKGHIVLDQTGRHERRWILSLDEGLLVRIRFWIRLNAVKNGEPNMTAQTFCDYLNKDVLPEVAATKEDVYDPFTNAPVTKIKNNKDEVVSYEVTERTARNWLHKLGCEYRDMQSGLYFDGHDCEDVLEYRVETYLPAYFEHLDYTEIWIDASLEEARSWEVETQPRDRREDGSVWVCVHAFADTLSELHPDLRARVTRDQIDLRRSENSWFSYRVFQAFSGGKG